MNWKFVLYFLLIGSMMLVTLRLIQEFMVLRDKEAELYLYKKYGGESLLYKVLRIIPQSLHAMDKETLFENGDLKVVSYDYNGKNVILLEEKKQGDIIPIYPYVDDEVASQKQDFNMGKTSILPADSSLTFVNLYGFNLWLKETDSCSQTFASKLYLDIAHQNGVILTDSLKLNRTLDSLKEGLTEHNALVSDQQYTFVLDKRSGLYKYFILFDSVNCTIENIQYEIVAGLLPQ